jgi:uncharacterized membrane protein YebE (DUF533 family)
MPVRIVKDNPDEELLNESFNFDNPNETNQQNNNQNSQEGSGFGGFNLGSITNMLFGGGGNRGHQGNSLISSLASMAIGACVNYALNSFRNSSRTSSSSFQSAAPNSREDLEELYQARMAAAETCVSLWAYAAGADRNFGEEEKQTIDNLIDSTIAQLFPSKVANQEDVKAELQQIFDRPLSYEQIVEQARQNKPFALQLYQQAALIIAADGNFGGREKTFLDTLTQDLDLGRNEVRAINQQYNL